MCALNEKKPADEDSDSDYEIEYEEKQFVIGGHELSVRTIAELPMELLFDLERAQDEISGQRAWPGSLLLGCELARLPGVVAGKSVAELGAGCGLVGMVAARLGAASCLATDGDDRCLGLLRENVERNGLSDACAVRKCLWGVDDLGATFDVVLAGDVLYKRELVDPFLAAVDAALAPHGTALLCHLPRAGVSHDVVAAAIAATGALRADCRRVVLGAAELAAVATFGDDCTAEDAANARFYEIARVDAGDDDAGDDETVVEERSCATDDGDAGTEHARYAVKVSNLGPRVSLGNVQAFLDRCGTTLVYRGSPSSVVAHLKDEAGLARALALDGSPCKGQAAAVARHEPRASREP